MPMISSQPQMPESPSAEAADTRRRHDRVAVSITGNLRRNIDARYSSVMMANLSLGGAFVTTPYPLEQGEHVMLEFPLPDKDRTLRIMGEVVWIREDVDLTGMGVRFTEVARNDLLLLRTYIDALLQEPPTP